MWGTSNARKCLLVKALLQRPHLDHMTVGFEPHLHYLQLRRRQNKWINIGGMELCRTINEHIILQIHTIYVHINVLLQLQSFITRLTRHDSVRGVSVTWYVWTCLNITVQTGQLPHSTDAKKCRGTESGKPLGGSFMHKNSSDQAARCPAIANAISWLGVLALHWLFFRLPSGNWTGCYWKLPFTVGLPLKIVIFQFAMLVYQRVSERIIHRSCWDWKQRCPVIRCMASETSMARYFFGFLWE